MANPGNTAPLADLEAQAAGYPNAAAQRAAQAAQQAAEDAAKKAAQEAAEAAAKKAAQKACEKTGKLFARQVGKDLGKDAQREFHDMKDAGGPDRTLDQLRADAQELYEKYGVRIPPWMQ